MNPKPPLPPSHHAKKPTYSSSRSPNPSPVSFRTPNPSSRSPNPSPVSSRSPNSRNHDEEDNISVITSTEDEISSTTGASVNTIHSLKSDHRQQINTQNVIGISPIDSHERMASSRHGYNPSRPTNNIVVTLPDFDRRKESFPSQI